MIEAGAMGKAAAYVLVNNCGSIGAALAAYRLRIATLPPSLNKLAKPPPAPKGVK